MESKENLDDLILDYLKGTLSDERTEEISALLETNVELQERFLHLQQVAAAMRRRKHKAAIEHLAALTENTPNNQLKENSSVKRSILWILLLLLALLLTWLFLKSKPANSQGEAPEILNVVEPQVSTDLTTTEQQFIEIATEYEHADTAGNIYASSILFEGVDIEHETPLKIWLGPNLKAEVGDEIYFLVFEGNTCYLYVDSIEDLFREANRESELPQVSANSCVESYFYDGRRPKKRLASKSKRKGRIFAKGIRC